MKTLQEIEARLAEIANLLASETDPDTIDKLVTESDELVSQRKAMEDAIEKRNATLSKIAKGAGTTVNSFGAHPTPASKPEERGVDKFDTPEYRKAFMEYVCRGVEIPRELRGDATTTTTTGAAAIPTTLMNEIVKKLEAHGNIYARVRKLNVPGGVDFPIVSVKPTAAWITEGTKVESQAITANTKVSFSYYGLECKIAQTILLNVTSIDAFQREFTELAVEAIIKKLEDGIFNGSGSGQMTGILNDTKIVSSQAISLTTSEFGSWSAWKKKVFAKIPKAYRNGIFAMSQGTFEGYIDGMVDDNGQPIGRVNYGIAGGEEYRFGGKTVETVEAGILADFDDAEEEDAVAVYFNPADYAINSNMQLTVKKWIDEDTDRVMTKAMMVVDGKLIDAHGVLIILKAEEPDPEDDEGDGGVVQN